MLCFPFRQPSPACTPFPPTDEMVLRIDTLPRVWSPNTHCFNPLKSSAICHMSKAHTELSHAGALVSQYERKISIGYVNPFYSPIYPNISAKFNTLSFSFLYLQIHINTSADKCIVQDEISLGSFSTVNKDNFIMKQKNS